MGEGLWQGVREKQSMLDIRVSENEAHTVCEVLNKRRHHSLGGAMYYEVEIGLSTASVQVLSLPSDSTAWFVVEEDAYSTLVVGDVLDIKVVELVHKASDQDGNVVRVSLFPPCIQSAYFADGESLGTVSLQEELLGLFRVNANLNPGVPYTARGFLSSISNYQRAKLWCDVRKRLGLPESCIPTDIYDTGWRKLEG